MFQSYSSASEWLPLFYRLLLSFKLGLLFPNLTEAGFHLSSFVFLKGVKFAVEPWAPDRVSTCMN